MNLIKKLKERRIERQLEAEHVLYMKGYGLTLGYQEITVNKDGSKASRDLALLRSVLGALARDIDPSLWPIMEGFFCAREQEKEQ